MTPSLDYLYNMQEPEKLVLCGHETGGYPVKFDLKKGQSLFFMSNVQGENQLKAYNVLFVERYEEHQNVFLLLDFRFSQRSYRFIQAGPCSFKAAEKSATFYLDPKNTLDLQRPGASMFFVEKVVSLGELYQILVENGLYRRSFYNADQVRSAFSECVKKDLNSILKFFTNQQI